ncbi:MAG: MotA/TolQ/ExbB proton channel family protein [Gemmatimonas sp.]|uniref:MotA/TolQ/ExbB proton channel family protein n=1 Tax=Gemmatimonas sp. TaxID=1962908 RepID=UPI00391F3EF1|nr:MotA/TolQ/ExbB proton channel family protein [Gemmatimonadota bacterium]
MIGSSALFLLQLSTRGGEAAERGIIELIISSDLVTKAVLIVLMVLSLVSWAIMFAKWRAFAVAEKHGHAFAAEFERARGMDDAMLMAQRARPSAFTAVFARAMQFLNDTKPALGATSDRTARLSGSQVEALRLVLDSETGKEREELGRFIPWLATVGSVSPLIGLFGTVLGVIQAFEGIATKGSGNIGAVAPGIATALIATAAALAVAIPAAFAYNVYAARLNRFDSALEGFGSELIALMVREGRI